ncbi:LysR substrate-binding domain-containing protein [Massilia sp. SYSU DXS3249]
MDLDAIHVFVKVVDSGSFSAAARLMKMPKTTVSAKVAGLEKRLGVSLLHRTTRKLNMTEAGQRYYEHCAKAVQEIELGEAALSSARDRPSGLLRVSVAVDVGHTLLPRIARAYLDRYPDTGVEMILSNRMSDLVGEGIDLAIRAGNLKDSSLVARRFIDLSAHLWASPRYLAAAGTPRTPGELAGHACVGFAGMRSVRLTKGKLETEVPLQGRVLADDFEAVRAMLVLDGGIGLLPDFVAAEAQAAGTLVPVLPDWTLGSFGGLSFVYPRQKYASPKVRAFIDTALELVETREP